MTITILWWHIPLAITFLLSIWGIVSPPNSAPGADFFQFIVIFGVSCFSWAVAASFFK